MCGIAGFLNPRNNDKKTEKEIYQILRKMNEVKRHRGPDDDCQSLTFTGDISQCVKRKKEIPTQSS